MQNWVMVSVDARNGLVTSRLSVVIKFSVVIPPLLVNYFVIHLVLLHYLVGGSSTDLVGFQDDLLVAVSCLGLSFEFIVMASILVAKLHWVPRYLIGFMLKLNHVLCHICCCNPRVLVHRVRQDMKHVVDVVAHLRLRIVFLVVILRSHLRMGGIYGLRNPKLALNAVLQILAGNYNFFPELVSWGVTIVEQYARGRELSLSIHFVQVLHPQVVVLTTLFLRALVRKAHRGDISIVIVRLNPLKTWI